MHLRDCLLAYVFEIVFQIVINHLVYRFVRIWACGGKRTKYTFTREKHNALGIRDQILYRLEGVGTKTVGSRVSLERAYMGAGGYRRMCKVMGRSGSRN